VTPHEVWFGRPPRLQNETVTEENSEEEEDTKDSADEEYIFSELHRKVF
jgi:hypothetical protein